MSAKPLSSCSRSTMATGGEGNEGGRKGGEEREGGTEGMREGGREGKRGEEGRRE